MRGWRQAALLLALGWLLQGTADAAAVPDAQEAAAPEPNAQFGQMDYVPAYPVFSWREEPGLSHYEVQVWKRSAAGDTLYKDLRSDGLSEPNTIYDWNGMTEPGDYYWKVRATDADGRAQSGWSAPQALPVTAPTPVAALGDSITHGGARGILPSRADGCWETYSKVPVKNLGYSGNTTEAMLRRFGKDVLPFSPKILVIMGGVNDYRQESIPVGRTIRNLIALREACEENGILPVFATVTPLNLARMAEAGMASPPPRDWLKKQQAINGWILRQKYHVDVAAPLTDREGGLKASLTPDGLHPLPQGKRLMGEAIGRYLMWRFPDILAQKPGKAADGPAASSGK